MTEQFRQDFFPNTEKHTLTFDILSDDWEALQALFAENDWTPDNGLCCVLAAGLAFSQGRAHLAELGHLLASNLLGLMASVLGIALGRGR